ncbi:MAG: radical SAM protein [Deltaproteobacteria bacterium]|nr:radical SAM protein [Deltaproteobacteria bacterium]
MNHHRRRMADHPCFYGSAQGRWGRIHLPVAPECNVHCCFCNRRYDCANEGRPGLTRRILNPDEVLSYLDEIMKDRTDISVVGIAGPGDPLCDPERTLKTVKAVHAAYPDLLLCLSTNGLNLTDHIADLAEAGVTHVTVTINAVLPQIGSHVYDWIRIGGKVYQGREAAERMIFRQREAIYKLKAKGVVVKINTVMLPGVNVDHIPRIAAEVAGWGADVMNCIPLIPLPNTPFAGLGKMAKGRIDHTRSLAALSIPQMYHCRRCRADAVGLLHQGE